MSAAQIDLVHMISNASTIVQLVLLLLLFFSVASWAIILIKYRYIKRAFKQSVELDRGQRSLLQLRVPKWCRGTARAGIQASGMLAEPPGCKIRKVLMLLTLGD